MELLKKIGRGIINGLKRIWEWILSLFITRYKVTVSFNKVYGDSDDKNYIAKKIITRKEKLLIFIDEDNNKIEFRSSTGLNYIIEDYL
tara:strand:- start:2222 stop:2485 length:264 start_codon:yes stop_codon:yes gene_type:complete